jgi:hypothetical protein
MVTFTPSEEPLTQPSRSPDISRRPPTIPYAGGSAPITAAAASAPPAPAPPPRLVTPAAKRRSWTDPIIRFWILATIVLLGIGGWFITQQVIESRNEQWLIANGTSVNAIVLSSGGDSRPGKKIPPGTPCTLQFDWKDEAVSVDGTLATNDFFTIGQTVPLRVDPNDTSIWTDRTAPEPLGRRLIAGAVVIPAVLITGAGALLLRRRLLRIWRDGDAVLYAVVETKYSALAPLSHTVACVTAAGRDPTIIVVYLPARFARPKPGDFLWLIRRPDKPKPAIAACAFE